MNRLAHLSAQAAKSAVRQLVRYLPRTQSRLTCALAVNGGTPVRDVRFRPWQGFSSATRREWYLSVGPALRELFMSGVEGLPQGRQQRFAEQWARFCGCRYGLLLPHGTDALRLAIAAVFDHDGLDYGGEVIVPNLSFIASATAPLDRRFGVAFVDVEAGTLNLDPHRVEEAIVPGRTRAIMAVHQFGQPADMTSLRVIASRHELRIIEDAAQAHGAAWEDGPVGSLGDAAGFSFQSAKNLTCGEGGILTTNDTQVYERAYSLHNAGRTSEESGRWEHSTLGWNVRPTEYQAALLTHRFRQFEHQQIIRKRNFDRLRDLLSDAACLRPLDLHSGVRRHGMYMFVLRYRGAECGGLSLDAFLQAVRAEGAPLHRCYASTLSSQVAMRTLALRHQEYIRVLPTPVADRAVGEIVYVSGNILLGSEADMDDIADAVKKVQRYFTTHPAAELQRRA